MLRYAPAGASDFESDSEDEFELYDPNPSCKGETKFNNLEVRHCNPTNETSLDPETGNTEETGPKAPDLVFYDLQTAIIRGNCEVVRHFMDTLQNPNVLLNSGWTCLMYASYFFQPKVIEILLEFGADVNRSDRDGKTALHLACHSTGSSDHNAQIKCTQKLIDTGANVHAADASGKTPLMYGVRGQNYGILDVLLQNPGKGLFLDAKDQNGFTALDWSAVWDNISAIEKLINAGAETPPTSSPSHKFWSDRVRKCFGEKKVPVENNQPDLSGGDMLQSTVTLEAGDSCQANNNKKDEGEKISEIELTDILSLLIEEESSKDKEYETYGQLELFLLGLGLPHVIKIFKEQDITFHQLLCLTMEELEYIGIQGLGTRKRILEAALDCHMKNENTDKLPDFTKVILTFDNTLEILSGVIEQTTGNACSLRYIKQHIDMYPNIIQPLPGVKYDQQPVVSLKEKLDDMLRSVHDINKSFRSLQKQVAQSEKCYTTSELTPSDFVVVATRPCKMGRVKKILLVALPAAGFVVTFLIKISMRLM